MNSTQEKKSLFVKITHKLKVNHNPLSESYWENKTMNLKTPNADRNLLMIVPFQDPNSPSNSQQIIVESFYTYPLSKKRYGAFNEFLGADKVIIMQAEDCPATIKEFINNNQNTWSQEGEDILKLLRWRYNQNFTLSNIWEQAFWSIDGEEWREMFVDIMSISLGAIWWGDNTDAENHLQNLINKNLNEPLYFDIFLEAKSQSTINERSAFVLAVIALELGVKQLISKLKPETAWLLEFIPSPPIEKLLKEYIPQILDNRSFSTSTLETVRNIIRERNELVHRGLFNLSFYQINERLQIIEDLLHLFDDLLGNNWALKYIEHKDLFSNES